MLKASDAADLQKRGKSVEETEQQLSRIAKGFSPAAVRRAATVGDGIARVSDEEARSLAAAYDADLAAGLSVAKFVPASGAASRMFKPLHQYLAASADDQAKMNDEEPWKSFFNLQDKFAFAKKLSALKPKNKADIVAKILGDAGLNYGGLPKGLVDFHRYPDGQVRTAAEEHIYEAVDYCLSGGHSLVHYTVPVGMEDNFRRVLDPVLKAMGGKVSVSFSIQPPSTDVPAHTADGQPARDAEGHLVFRPGGHGALIGNLGRIDADAVFVKNIDNVAHGRLMPQTSLWKKVIASYGLLRKRMIDSILLRLDKDEASAVADGFSFLDSELKISAPAEIRLADFEKQKFYLLSVLDRPLRVCGMVKNEGEPGGGPFWVEGKDGVLSLQIVESAQMNLEDPKVASIVAGSSHFNPVDLFCCLKDRHGKSYDLSKFIDHDAAFQTHKSVNGVDVTGMELPGLWNGAMAHWLTFFVEVPVITFNPVKTVMDLLRPVHQL